MIVSIDAENVPVQTQLSSGNKNLDNVKEGKLFLTLLGSMIEGQRIKSTNNRLAKDNVYSRM